LDKDFKELASIRCEKAIEENNSYMEDELSGKFDQDELQSRSEILCYFQGMRDMANLLGISMNSDIAKQFIDYSGSQNR
jgi:hypothetical protein